MTIYKAIIFNAIREFSAAGKYEIAKRLRQFVAAKEIKVNDFETELMGYLGDKGILPTEIIKNSCLGYRLRYVLPNEA